MISDSVTVQGSAISEKLLVRWQKIGLATLSALCFILIFPPFNLEALGWVTFVPLLLAMRDASPKEAFWLGWLNGLLGALGTVYWVVIAMVSYGNMPVLLSVLALLLMASFLGLYVGVFACLVRWIERQTLLPLLLTVPAIWVAFEYARAHVLFPFPWSYVGYSQYLTPIVTQIADTTGVYGVSFFVMLVNAGLYSAIFSRVSRTARRNALIVTSCVVAVSIGYGVFVLFGANTLEEKTVKVAVVQGNIDQGIKWDKSFKQHILDTYVRLSTSIAAEKPDLIVWPETAAPFLFLYDVEPQQQMIDLARKLNTFLLFGSLHVTPIKGTQEYNSYNSAFLLSPPGSILGKYDKMQLVPFGEYVPFKRLLFFVDRITTAIGEVKAGTVPEVMQANDTLFSVVICFESTFPNLVRKFVDNGARFVVIITNDAWYGRSAAAAQHFSMAAFRAIENRTAIARAANTGISGFIDPYGRILQQSDEYVEAALAHDIPIRTTITFYTRFGDVFAWLCCAAAVGAIGLGWMRRNV